MAVLDVCVAVCVWLYWTCVAVLDVCVAVLDVCGCTGRVCGCMYVCVFVLVIHVI